MSSKVNKIIVPIDLSEQSLSALTQTYNLARKLNAEIVLVFVLEELSPTVKFLYKELVGIEEKVESNLKKIAEEKEKKTGLKFSTVILKGKIYNQIVRYAKKVDALLIIMGTQGSSRTKFIGSNALKVVKTAPCPVITVKGMKNRPKCNRILLPLDLTKETIEKVTEAIHFAKLFNATIYIYSVLLIEKKEIKEQLIKQLTIVKEKILKENVNCVQNIQEIKKGKGQLIKSVINYSQEIDADLIMIMTQQESNFKEIFIGSRAQGIINNSEIPVISILPERNR